VKKRLIIYGMAFCFLVLTVSQAHAIQIAGKGVKVGFSMANVSGKYVDVMNDIFNINNSARIGLALGGYLTINVSDNFSVQPELLFVQKGTKWSKEEWKLVYRFSYLEIPILAKYSFTAGSDMKAFVFAGPALAFKVGATIYGKDEDESETEDFDDAKGMDFGVVFGAGMEKPFGKNVITVDVRYTLGLSNCSEEKEFDFKNSAILIMAGIGF